MTAEIWLNLHAILDRSRSNGPGERMVVWFQGCDLGCPGCCNPQTHAFQPQLTVSAEAIAEQAIAAGAEIEGITLSGGEPLAQTPGLLRLLQLIRSRSSLSILLFSGYRWEEIQSLPLGIDILRMTDVLVAGRYVYHQARRTGLVGSANQRIHLLSNRYTLKQVTATPEIEICIGPRGDVLSTGIGVPELRL